MSYDSDLMNYVIVIRAKAVYQIDTILSVLPKIVCGCADFFDVLIRRWIFVQLPRNSPEIISEFFTIFEFLSKFNFYRFFSKLFFILGIFWEFFYFLRN